MESDRESLFRKNYHKSVSYSPISNKSKIIFFDFYYRLLSCLPQRTSVVSSQALICLTHLNFQMNSLKKKIRKEHENIFCGLSQLLKNISWSINTCLKYFMTSATALQPHFIYLMYSHFLMKSIMFVSKFPEILDDEFKITLLSILINFKNHITKTPTQIFPCEYQRFLRTTILKISWIGCFVKPSRFIYHHSPNSDRSISLCSVFVITLHILCNVCWT